MLEWAGRLVPQHVAGIVRGWPGSSLYMTSLAFYSLSSLREGGLPTWPLASLTAGFLNLGTFDILGYFF